MYQKNKRKYTSPTKKTKGYPKKHITKIGQNQGQKKQIPNLHPLYRKPKLRIKILLKFSTLRISLKNWAIVKYFVEMMRKKKLWILLN